MTENTEFDLTGKLIKLSDSKQAIPAESRQALLKNALLQCRREATKIVKGSNDGNNCCKYCSSWGDSHEQNCPVAIASDIYWIAFYAVEITDREE